MDAVCGPSRTSDGAPREKQHTVCQVRPESPHLHVAHVLRRGTVGLQRRRVGDEETLPERR